VADKLVIAGVVYTHISFSQLPNGTFNTSFSGGVDFAVGSIFISLFMRPA
jgi:hypothetical protein